MVKIDGFMVFSFFAFGFMIVMIILISIFTCKCKREIFEDEPSDFDPNKGFVQLGQAPE